MHAAAMVALVEGNGISFEIDEYLSFEKSPRRSMKLYYEVESFNDELVQEDSVCFQLIAYIVQPMELRCDILHTIG